MSEDSNTNSTHVFTQIDRESITNHSNYDKKSLFSGLKKQKKVNLLTVKQSVPNNKSMLSLFPRNHNFVSIFYEYLSFFIMI